MRHCERCSLIELSLGKRGETLETFTRDIGDMYVLCM